MELGSPEDLAVRIPWTRLLELMGLACWNRQRGAVGSSSLMSWSVRLPEPRSRMVPTTVARFPLSWLGSVASSRWPAAVANYRCPVANYGHRSHALPAGPDRGGDAGFWMPAANRDWFGACPA